MVIEFSSVVNVKFFNKIMFKIHFVVVIQILVILKIVNVLKKILIMKL